MTARERIPIVHPSNSLGWAHVWDGDTQLALSDGQVSILVYLGVIRYTGDYRVYAPPFGWTCETIKERYLDRYPNAR